MERSLKCFSDMIDIPPTNHAHSHSLSIPDENCKYSQHHRYILYTQWKFSLFFPKKMFRLKCFLCYSACLSQRKIMLTHDKYKRV